MPYDNPKFKKANANAKKVVKGAMAAKKKAAAAAMKKKRGK